MHGDTPRLVWLPMLAAAIASSILMTACMRREPEPRAAAVFGGKGAQVAALDEKPLPSDAGVPREAGPCGKAAPPSDTALLDDFEDADNKLFKGFQREGYWFSASDNTQGSVIEPSGDFAAELLPTSQATKHNRYAAHLSASGQTQWGVIWGSGLHWVNQGIKCPLNLSGFAGLRFRAKGPGKVRVSLSVPEVVPSDSGGTCREGCYDTHGKPFLLGEQWDTYELRWERLQQAGWGAEARFTPSRVVSLNVNVDVKSLPIDFWLDDLELIPNSAPP